MGLGPYGNTLELQTPETQPLSKSYYHEETSSILRKPTLQKASWRTRFSGWRGGVIACILLTTLVLLLNVIFAITAVAAWDPKDGIATAFTGDCTLAARWTTVIHLFINLLSSLLLGASNYCMQRLVAPTRQEIDDAHAKKKWLDIGMPSLRNLSAIHKGRMWLWIVLGLSSVPLHFVYNSVVFETIGANDVSFLRVAPEFFTIKDSWYYGPYNATWDNRLSRLQNTLLDGKYLNSTIFEHLTAEECISRYTAVFITSGPGFGVPTTESRISSNLTAANTLREENSGSGDLQVEDFPGEPPYAYCLSQKEPDRCQVQFSLNILYIVIICNIVKISVMVAILLRLNHETIVTIGDAIKSFLQRPDQTTENCCLLSRRNIDRVWKLPEERPSERYEPLHRETWFWACSRRRWGLSLLLYTVVLIVAGVLLHIALAIKSRSLDRTGWNNFGQVDISYLIDVPLPFGDTSIIPYVLFANIPQAVISFIYLTYNGIFTAMLANREWAQYAIKRAPLRVTIPSASQRSTYFLQLPYTFSVPLLIASTVLHWFISQAIFLARIAIYKDGKIESAKETLIRYGHMKMGKGVFTGVGYSDSALIACVTWGSVIVAAILLVANLRTYPRGLPVGGTNSAVISAACHVKYENSEVEEKVTESVADRPVQWGVTILGSRETVGHCCFSSGNVGAPTIGFLYAGVDAKIKSA